MTSKHRTILGLLVFVALYAGWSTIVELFMRDMYGPVEFPYTHVAIMGITLITIGLIYTLWLIAKFDEQINGNGGV